ncbi:ORF6N domain-containing protein [Raoultella ornithinolytica]|nr:ORF6N domain-containing protein [Raoultella ornithinolytica]MDI0395874.1 ORF6N domain-containing protein [Raoultella ornithinolytica]MDI0424577.1 ORF6N domain-containing protein [Raoultella ornithinolytica]MDI0442156.1 ORF6N domain-containing protein [Raoultella ornithinolytica]MDI0448371.1 ORF6N domain-containing protein [Raoultella ornithinolytica]
MKNIRFTSEASPQSKAGLVDITIQVKQPPAVEFHGQRVVTFAMIDEAHRRPRDTAKKAFQRNRARFVDGDDFFIVGASEVEWDVTDHLARGIKRPGKKMNSPIRGRVTLITESGYLLLTKPFNDDLAWQVQRQLVKAYFRCPEVVTFQHVELPSLKELAAMPVIDAQNTVTRAGKHSKRLHGSQGSNGMNLRKKELKALRPAERLVDAMGQIGFDEYEWEVQHDRA